MTSCPVAIFDTMFCTTFRTIQSGQPLFTHPRAMGVRNALFDTIASLLIARQTILTHISPRSAFLIFCFGWIQECLFSRVDSEKRNKCLIKTHIKSLIRGRLERPTSWNACFDTNDASLNECMHSCFDVIDPYLLLLLIYNQ